MKPIVINVTAPVKIDRRKWKRVEKKIREAAAIAKDAGGHLTAAYLLNIAAQVRAPLTITFEPIKARRKKCRRRK